MGWARIGRRMLALAAGLAVALAGAELVCRIDAFFPGQVFDSARAREFFAARAEPQAAVELRAYGRPDPGLSEAEALPFVHPFVGWSSGSTDDFALEMVRATGAGDDASFDLLLLGGSVAGNLSSLGAPRLAEILEADPRLAGRRVRIWSFARPSYRAPQPFAWYAWLHMLGARPDAVLLIDGFNEVAMSLENPRRGIHPVYPASQYWSSLARGARMEPELLDLIADVRIARREQLRIAAQARDQGFHRSAFLTRIAERRLHTARIEVESATERLRARQSLSAASDRAVSGPRFVGDDRAAVSAAVDAWAATSRALHVLCAERGIPCLEVVQPTLADPGSKRISPEEARRSNAVPEWSEAVAIGYPLLRERVAEMRSDGLAVVDATRAFAAVEETLFTDVVHFDERGNVALVEWLAPHLRALLR